MKNKNTFQIYENSGWQKADRKIKNRIGRLIHQLENDVWKVLCEEGDDFGATDTVSRELVSDYIMKKIKNSFYI